MFRKFSVKITGTATEVLTALFRMVGFTERGERQ